MTPYPIFHPGPRQLFPFFPFTSISTVVLYLPFSFLYYLPISSPLLTLLHLPPFLYHSDTSPPVPLYLDLVLRDYIPPPNFSVTELFTVFSFYLPSVFPSLIVHIITFLGLPARANFTMEYHCTMTHLLFFLLYFAIYYHLLY